MSGKVGDRILLESEQVGSPPREGEILEVVQGQLGVRYRIRWADGHESVLRPTSGAATIVPGSEKKRS
jgi:hypothetical protein